MVNASDIAHASPLTPPLSPSGRGSPIALVDTNSFGLPLPDGERVGVRGSRKH